MSFQDFISRAELNYNSYQEEGVKWCIDKEMYDTGIYDDFKGGTVADLKGGIVADEMGLGKTITILGTMYLNPLHCTIIVVPVALIEQWSKAIKSYLNIDPIIYHGQNKSPFILAENINGETPVVVITTYGVLAQRKPIKNDGIKLRPRYLVRNDYLNSILYNINWNRIIYDEAHNMRNNSTQKFWSCNMLQSNIKWCVTGTPIQNKLRDVRNLLRLFNIPPKDMKTTNQLEVLIETHMLRRTKIQAGINLPPLEITNTSVEWKSDFERKLNLKFMEYQQKARRRYNEIDFILGDDFDHVNDMDLNSINSSRSNNSESSEELEFDLHNNDVALPQFSYDNGMKNNILSILEQRQLGVPGTKRQLQAHYRNNHLLDEDIEECATLLENNMLTSMIRGRQMCIYPALILPKLQDHIKENKLSRGINQLENYSSKLDAVVEHIQNNNSINRKIVFCNFKKEMNQIYTRLINSSNGANNSYNENNIACYDGSLNHRSRRSIINNHNLKLLIIQIQTACDGLNLQHYNEVYFVSPCWNPSMEDQAIARCHRMGQTKTTKVYRFQMRFDDTQLTNMDDYIELNQRNKRSVIRELY